MAQKKTEKSMSTAQKVGLGVGLTAAAIAAAGGYFLYGSKNAAQNRKKVKSWTLKAKGEVLEALEKAGRITEEEYKALVEAASGTYGALQKATKGELKEFQAEMHDHWKKLQKSTAVKKVAAVVTKKVPKGRSAHHAPAKNAVVSKKAVKK